MKINLEIEVSKEAVQLLAKNIVKQEDVEAYVKEILTQTVNQFIAKIPEVYAALSAGVEKEEIFAKAAMIGSNIADETHRKFNKDTITK